jgi:hypothetical protein
MLEAEAPKHKLGRQVFWLTAHHGFPAAFPLPISNVDIRGSGLTNAG